mgnify:CR=1 FL=1
MINQVNTIFSNIRGEGFSQADLDYISLLVVVKFRSIDDYRTKKRSTNFYTDNICI